MTRRRVNDCPLGRPEQATTHLRQLITFMINVRCVVDATPFTLQTNTQTHTLEFTKATHDGNWMELLIMRDVGADNRAGCVVALQMH